MSGTVLTVRSHLWAAAAAAGMLGSAGLCSAQSAPADQNTSSSSQEVALQPILVSAPRYVPTTDTSATKIEIPLIETPQSITVVNRDQLDVLNVQNLQQAIRYTSGVVGENYGPDERYDWLTMRGFQPVEYIDGLQAPVGSTQNVGLDLWGAQSVEVLKGPSGVLYGQSPPGGLVNVTMRRPERDFSAEAQAQYGSFDDKQLAADITGSLLGDGLIEGRLTALWRDRDTQTDFVSSKRLFVAPALTLNMTPDTALTLLGYYQKDSVLGDGGGFLPAQGTILPNPNGHIPVGFDAGEPGYNRFDRHQWGIGYDFSQRFNRHFTFRQNLKLSRYNDWFQSIYGAGLQADLTTLNRYNFVYPEDIRQFAVVSRMEIRGETGPIQHVALVGVDYRDLRNDTDFGFGSGPPLDVFHPVYGLPIPALSFPLGPSIREDQKQVGVYGQDELKLDHWRLTLSAREDHLNTVNFGATSLRDSAFTHREGLNYVFSSGFAPYVAYSTSFLPTSGSDYFGRPFLPSTGKMVEGGLKYEPHFAPRGVRLFASAAVYDLKQQHVLTNDPDHAFFSVQTGEVEVRGVELEAVARINEQLNINGSYTYTDSNVTRNTDPTLIGKELPIVSPHKFSLLGDYTIARGFARGFGGGLGVRYLSSAFGDPQNTLPTGSVTLLDGLLHYQFGNWKLVANATNVLDKIYIQRCSDLTQCFYGTRRTVTVTLDRRW